MSDAARSRSYLPEPWQVAFEEAWTSFVAGSAGVDAVVTDGGGVIVTTGRSRVFDEPDGMSPLAGTWMAHAEMNALAQLPRSARDGHTLYTTFEPCVMCAATIRIYRMPKVAYAAADPVWDGLPDHFARFESIARGMPERERLGGPWGAFAHILHLSWLADHGPDHVLGAHGKLSPEHLRVASRVASNRNLRRLADGRATVVDAAATLWKDVESLADPVRLSVATVYALTRRERVVLEHASPESEK